MWTFGLTRLTRVVFLNKFKHPSATFKSTQADAAADAPINAETRFTYIWMGAHRRGAEGRGMGTQGKAWIARSEPGNDTGARSTRARNNIKELDPGSRPGWQGWQGNKVAAFAAVK